jgi:hypothetical protein
MVAGMTGPAIGFVPLQLFYGAICLRAGYTGAACDTLVPDAKPNHKSPMGVEVAGLAYWSAQWVFLDVMKQSSAWMTQNAPDT